MLIINADDWGRTPTETDKTMTCYKEERITSVTAMVFMEDSFRAAKLAQDEGIDVGLHLNLNQHFTGKNSNRLLDRYHENVSRFLTFNKYIVMLYNPALRKQFRYIYQAQVDEFFNLYGVAPSHIDGHHHFHLCMNMLVDKLIPEGERIRRNFSFWPGEKNIANRLYRQLIDLKLRHRYILTDHFFSLGSCIKERKLQFITDLAKTAIVELMTHPANKDEYNYLMSDKHRMMMRELKTGTYSLL